MKTVLITGGSRGIGEAAVRLFAKEGYAVAFTYKDSGERAARLAAECGALAVRADSSSDDEIRLAVDRVISELGHIDCLVNNAGVSAFGLLSDTSADEWDALFRTNVRGAYLYSSYVLRDMIKRHEGRIINISSVWGLVGSSYEVCYSASKAAVIGMTKALAKEVGPSGITVNAIAPGVIETDMNQSLSESDLSALREQTPLGRLGKPHEVAAAALFLAGEGAAFITGEVVNISGGFVIN